jgi:hypothetical protein
MAHISNPRVIDNHAAMGKSPPAAPDTPFLTLENIFRAGARRAARRREILAAQMTRDSESRAPRSRHPNTPRCERSPHLQRSPTPLHSVIDADNSVAQARQSLGPNQQLACAGR